MKNRRRPAGTTAKPGVSGAAGTGAGGERMDALGRSTLMRASLADVAALREVARRRRLRILTWSLALLAAWMWLRLVSGHPVSLGMPSFNSQYGPSFLIVGLLGTVLLLPMIAAGRSPHVLYRPTEIDVTLDDVKGARTVRDEVVRTLNLFLAYKTFQEQMGGTPRRAILFEGPPGTGKTYMAKAMAREAGVPFLFVSSSAFQSMYYGQTNRKIRSYFRALRKVARSEGGAIGFIEEIDAIGAARAGMGSGGREGISGVVNELLIQLQSFDEPTLGARISGWFVDHLNRLLPPRRQRRSRPTQAANVLIVGATNRAGDLDPALLRPGRFDRSVHFDLPSRAERREIIDYYLDRKAHTAELDEPQARDALAAATSGYSPVMIEHLFDEALVWALRRGDRALDRHDLQQAKLTEELGLGQPVEYEPHELRVIATHEAGHATVAYLVGRAGYDLEPEGLPRQLDVLSVVKRRESLGLTAHSDGQERFTKTRGELQSLLKISFGGLVAEDRWFSERSTGPAGDLQAATTLAAQMVGSFGMAGSLVSFEASDLPGNIVAKVLADDRARESLEELLEQAKAEVERMIDDHAYIVEALRDSLLERMELVGDEILDVIHAAEAANTVIDLRDPVLPDPAEAFRN
jgi:ATP-dependent Zn protease